MADYEVTHTTQYRYSEKVTHCQNVAYLLPQSDNRQQCENPHVTINPEPAATAEHTDYFGNKYLYFAIEEPHDELVVTTKTRVATQVQAFGEGAGQPWTDVAEALREAADAHAISAAEFLLPSPFVVLDEAFASYARESFSDNRPIREATLELAARIRKDFTYEQKSTTILTPLSEVFRKRKGVCQDFAHLSIAALRSLGLAARYVSGYIETYPPAGKPKLRGSDASHAWISVFCGAEGWLDFDPTNGKAISEEFIVTARGRDFGDVSPLKGILFGGGKHTLKVEVDVHRLG